MPRSKLKPTKAEIAAKIGRASSPSKAKHKLRVVLGSASSSAKRRPGKLDASASIRKKLAASKNAHKVKLNGLQKKPAGALTSVGSSEEAHDFFPFLRVTEASHNVLNGCWKLQQEDGLCPSPMYKKFGSDLWLFLDHDNKRWCFGQPATFCGGDREALLQGPLAMGHKASASQCPQDVRSWSEKQGDALVLCSLKVVGFHDDNLQVTVVSLAGDELLNTNVWLDVKMNELKDDIDNDQLELRDGVPERVVRLLFKDQELDTDLPLGSIGFDGSCVLQGVFQKNDPCLGCNNQVDVDVAENRCSECDGACCGKCDSEVQRCGGGNYNGFGWCGGDSLLCEDCAVYSCESCDVPICEDCADNDDDECGVVLRDRRGTLYCESCGIERAEAAFAMFD